MKENHVSYLFKDIRRNKVSCRSQSNTHKLKRVLIFIVDYKSCFFLLVTTFLIITFTIFLLCLDMHVRTQHVSSYVFPCYFLVFGKPTAWLFKSLLIPGDQTKKIKGCDGGIPYKHLCMLIFRVVSPSLTKKNKYTAYSKL